jgi:hypothetical protein
MRVQFGNSRRVININNEVDISPPLTDKEAYAEWKLKSTASMEPKKPKKEEVVEESSSGS